MRTSRDKHVIEQWLRLYNRLTGSTYRAATWPDTDSSQKNIDALCKDACGHELALEHTLIEPFTNEKADAARFLRTLAPLENDPALCLQGYTCIATQRVGAISNGVRWADLHTALRDGLAAALPTLPEGRSTVPVSLGRFSLDIYVRKTKTSSTDRGKFLTGRLDPGEPGPELIRNALERKLPKLAAAIADKRILLLEQDGVAGMIEDQYALVRNEAGIKSLRNGVDEIWGVVTAILESEDVIYTNPIDPQEHEDRSFCSLNVKTDEFWQMGP
jgi:hypothetical protein